MDFDAGNADMMLHIWENANIYSSVSKGGEQAADLLSCLHSISVCPVDASSEPLKSRDPSFQGADGAAQ